MRRWVIWFNDEGIREIEQAHITHVAERSRIEVSPIQSGRHPGCWVMAVFAADELGAFALWQEWKQGRA